jgi:flagellar hook protein FlgE
MSILKAMYSGASGLNAEGQALGVVGDNVANTNTVGFKQSRAVFEDVLGGALGTRGAGSGVRMARAQQIFGQGTLVSTGQATDLALSGDGFFVVKGSVAGVTGDFYTRAGQATLRQDGALVNPQGMEFVGYAASPAGGFGTQLGPVKVSTAALAPKATSLIDVTANLDANATPPAADWDPTNPAATSNFSTTVTVYDSLGNAHALDVYFRNTGPGAWDYHAMADGGELSGGTAGQPAEVLGGTLTFGGDGALLDAQVNAGGTADFLNATPGQPLAINFGTPQAAGGTGFGGTTQFGTPSSVAAQGQDGYASGSLAGVQIDNTGVVNAVYTNGEKLAVAKMAVAKFSSNDGLGRAGQNLWAATGESGEPSIGAAGEGGRAAVVAGSLEQSNVDLAAQFVDLIAHQRAFQANSKTITTADEMLQELVNLKRLPVGTG